MTAPLVLLAALLAGAYIETPKSDVRAVKFQTQTLRALRAKAGSSYSIRGEVRVDMSFARATVSKPLLRIVCLCDVGGELQWMEGYWDRPGTYDRLTRSAQSAAFKAAGREGACSEPGCVSAVMPMGPAATYASAAYGDSHDENGAFFRVSRAKAGFKLLLYRLEVWQNGVCVEAVESSRSGLGTYEIPRDWFVRGRHQGRFRYLRAN